VGSIATLGYYILHRQANERLGADAQAEIPLADPANELAA
jgi:hypothetical protein